MRPWQDGPAYRAARRAFADGDLEREGGPLDVRAVVAGIPAEAKDGSRARSSHWERFCVSQTVMRTREGPAVTDGRAFTRAC
ncbi:hypothetical protein [Streptomyces thermolilacinus]|uniref:Uncharacterized protein n=1 Tax=Streptomyces thermolilacinus SPC6 TaxID=1306406 RepID=A0A1D3DQ46_9ACTN|nr:hypothetical protein [Streptomyces thermolilacinus]OEJ94448.1 hypothetical protein J116_008170 [Streptomyces thermolilacinus SPC6]